MTGQRGSDDHAGTQVHHPVFARLYAREAAAMESRGAAALRRRLLDGCRGRVVEIGAGTGLNLAHYGEDVRSVVAVEPEPHLRARAREAARAAPVPVEVVDAVAASLPAADGTFDTAVTSLVLCSVPDQAAALEEIRRVLRPGGRLHFWEHVRARDGVLRPLQRIADATVWPRLAGGCHTSRDTLAAMEAAGFHVERVERFRFPDIRLPLPPSTQVLGTARR